eukprot:g25963.t1
MEEPFPPLAPEGGELSEEIRSYPLQLEREELLGALNFLNIEKPVQPQEAEAAFGLQEPFKLSKFKRVRAKVTSFRQKSEAAEILELDIAAQMNEEEPRSKIENDKLPRDEDEPVEQ